MKLAVFCTITLLLALTSQCRATRVVKEILMPPDVVVEGVTHLAGTNYLAADIFSGRILLVDIATELIATVVPATTPNTTSVGVHGSKRRVFAAGAGPGLPGFSFVARLNVYHTVTGDIEASCPIADGVVVNDVVADAEYAYYTDAGTARIYQLRLSALPNCDITTITMPEEIRNVEGFSTNGIIKYKGGLLVALTNLQTVAFIDLLNNNKVTIIAPRGSLPGIDGLAIHRRRGGSLLYAVQNSENLISEHRLSITRQRMVSMTKTRDITYDGFEFPTTAAYHEETRTMVVANANIIGFPFPPGRRHTLVVMKL